MGQKSYFSLLTLCAILAQSMAILSEDNTEEESHLHLRKKRIIDKVSQQAEVSIQYAPYIVNLLKNGVSHCGATILSSSITLTAAHCFNDNHALYTVLSGSAARNSGSKHFIQKIIKHPNYNPHTLSFDLALFKVSPNFVFGIQLNRAAQLIHVSAIPAGTVGTFSGWGCEKRIPLKLPQKLRSTHLSTTNPRFCQELYRSRNIHILDQHICALDRTGSKGSCTGDDGGPLIIDGNKLIGVFSHRNGDLNGQSPEVFMNIADHEIQTWISRTMNTNSNWFGLPRTFSVHAH